MAYRLLENQASMWRRNLNTPKFIYRVLKRATPRFSFTVPLPFSRRALQPLMSKPEAVRPLQVPLDKWCAKLQKQQAQHEESLPPPRFPVQEVLRWRAPFISPDLPETDGSPARLRSLTESQCLRIEGVNSPLDIQSQHEDCDSDGRVSASLYSRSS